MKLYSRRGKGEEKKEMRLPLSLYMTYLLVATLLFTGVSFSRYATTASSADSARVAAFSITTSGEATSALTLDLGAEMPSVTDSYRFSVTSNSEVAVKDEITVTVPGGLPSGVTMIMKEEGVPVKGSGSGEIYSYIKNFEPGNESHNWELSFRADPNNVTQEIAVTGITIRVDAVQID